MSDNDTRVVGERGQVTIPKRLREAFGICGGDEVRIHADEGKIVIESAPTRDDLAEGYRRRAQHHRNLVEEMQTVSQEANANLGDAPDWEE